MAKAEAQNNGSGVSWRVLIAVLGLAVAVITFFIGQISVQAGLDKRTDSLEQNRLVVVEKLVRTEQDVDELRKIVSGLQQDRAMMLEKLANIETSVQRIERKLFDGGVPQ